MCIECEAKIGCVTRLRCTFAASATVRRSSSSKAKRIAPSIEHACERSSVSQPVNPGFTSGPRAISLVAFEKSHERARRRILASRETNRKPFAA